MPELPEVETIINCLSLKTVGLRVRTVELLLPSLLRGGKMRDLRRLEGRRIKGFWRRGKMIIVDFEESRSLLFHLKMTGQFILCSSHEPRDKHTHLVLSFEHPLKDLRYRDIRKFGFVKLARTPGIFLGNELKNLGPEPLELDFLEFKGLFAGRKAQLKRLLLSQDFMAGIGNIYADEILFEARLHPSTKASRLKEKDLRRLWQAMRRVLQDALNRRGSSVRDFRDPDGGKGSFQERHRVYGKGGQACLRCGQSISVLKFGGRSSYFCAACQVVL